MMPLPAAAIRRIVGAAGALALRADLRRLRRAGRARRRRGGRGAVGGALHRAAGGPSRLRVAGAGPMFYLRSHELSLPQRLRDHQLQAGPDRVDGADLDVDEAAGERERADDVLGQRGRDASTPASARTPRSSRPARAVRARPVSARGERRPVALEDVDEVEGALAHRRGARDPSRTSRRAKPGEGRGARAGSGGSPIRSARWPAR